MKGIALFFVLFFIIFVNAQNCGPSAGGKTCPAGECCSKWGFCGTTAEHCTGVSCGSGFCKPGECCSQWGYCGTTPEHCGTSSSTSAKSSSSSSSSTTAKSTSTTGSNTGCKLSDIFSLAQFNQMFPHANGGAINGVANQKAIFNYNDLINAAAKFYPKFGCEGSLEVRKREVAAFLAQTSQETSGWWSGQPYEWGYYYSSEVGCSNTGCGQYCTNSAAYPCTPGKSYFGRGPLQLSHNYNYGPVSQAVFGDLSLLTNPDKLIENGEIAFRTSLWFWMTPQNPKPSSHDVITGIWVPSANDNALKRYPGFGMTTNIINGGLECQISPSPQKVVNRVKYFERYTAIFGISTGSNLYCDQMTHY